MELWILFEIGLAFLCWPILTELLTDHDEERSIAERGIIILYAKLGILWQLILPYVWPYEVPKKSRKKRSAPLLGGK